MAFICGDCHKEHPVPTVQEDLDGTPCFDALLRHRDELLTACNLVLAECEERNAQEGMALTLSEKAEWLTPGFCAMVAAVKKARTV